MESDGQLVQRVLKGDRQAYGLLVERYQHAVFASALRTIGDREGAEDAAQNAFISAYEKLDQLRDANAFGAWLLKIVRREAVHHVRSQARMVPLNAEYGAAEAMPDLLIDNETLKSVMYGLDRLAEHEQQVLMLRYFQSRPVADIAAMTGRSVGTVTKQISRALTKLREQLGGINS